jgi:prepilin-type N-terminal cleavage/methylation domain-containing protein
MLIRINRLFARVRRSDEGFTLVEVVVALVLFSVVTLGAIAAVGTITGMTADNRNREVAANLAQQAIDSSRVDARTDIMGMADQTTYPQVDGTTYTVSRTVSWLTTQSVDSKCSTTLTTGTGALLFRHVNVTVKWPNMRTSTAAVRSDTVFSPTSKINDPSAGTILISVQSITGSGGVAGVTATLTPNSAVSPNTAQVIAGNAQPAVTNPDGCTYATKVPPGAYTVTVSGPSGTNYRDTKQQATSSQSVVVKAGDSAGASFTYDPAGDIQLAYASNYTGPSPVLPTDLTTTFVSTLDPYTTSTPSVDNYLSPLPSGYSVYAGKYSADTTSAASCRSVDPTQWPTAADGRTGKAPAPVSATPGGTSTQPAQVAMGVVTINIKNSDKLVVAKTTTAQNGDPGCRAGMTYTFPRATTGNNGNTTMTIALPFGTWAITSGTSASSQSNITLGTLIGSIIGSVFGGSSSGQGNGQNVVILDPRS